MTQFLTIQRQLSNISIKLAFLSVFVASTMTACVTINIYFPAAAAEKAADKIIDDVWQLKNGGKSENSEKPTVKTEEPSKESAPPADSPTK